MSDKPTCPHCGGHNIDLVERRTIWFHDLRIEDGMIYVSTAKRDDETNDNEFLCRDCNVYVALMDENGEVYGYEFDD